MEKKNLKRLLVAALLLIVGSSGLAACSNSSSKSSNSKKPLTIVFLPSDSAKEEGAARTALKEKISQATGRKVKVETTTDYNVTIQAIASNKAQIALLGPDSYIQARSQSKHVEPIVTYSGKSGTLKDAYYHSYIMVNKADASQYQKNGKYSLDNIKGKTMSFVSNTSTSGFAVPAGAIKSKFNLKSTNQLAQGGKFFSKVLYGQSHQGSALNLLSGNSQIAAFDDIDLVQYGKFLNNSTKAGAIFKINNNASAPLNKVAGKESIAIAVYKVQNEPIAVNNTDLSRSEIKKIQNILTSKKTTNDKRFFAPSGSNSRSLFTKDGKTQFVKINDSWYKPTHEILGK
jgi:phosphonate transport system substrate-binding protein